MLFDTQTLTRIVERSFDLSMSGALPAETRAQYLTHGKRLREQLMQLLSARFDANSAEFKQATDAMHNTNHALAEAADDLNKVTQAVARLTELAGYLDKALGIAKRVVS
jgi:prophage DNA circulation protein